MTDLRRRDLLVGTALVLMGERVARAGIIAGQLPWAPNAGSPPDGVTAGPWLFFTAAEAAAVEALADRIIPPDSGIRKPRAVKDAGCAGVTSIGSSQGPTAAPKAFTTAGRSRREPRSRVRNHPRRPRSFTVGLAALDRYCRSQGGKPWVGDAGGAAGRDFERTRERHGPARGRRRQSLLRRSSSMMCRRASSPTRSMAATATCAPGR